MQQSPILDPSEMPSKRSKLACSYCERTFAKAEHLIRHERSHTKSQPYHCELCERRFSRKDSLARHHRLHARSSESPYALQTGLRSPGASLRDDSVYPETPFLPSPPRLPSRAHPVSAERQSMSDATFNMGPLRTPSVFSDTDVLRTGEISAGPLPAAPTDFETFALNGLEHLQPDHQIPPPLSNDYVDIMELLSCDVLPGSTSLRASPGFLDILGLGTDLFSANRASMAEPSAHVQHDLSRMDQEQQHHLATRNAEAVREPSSERSEAASAHAPAAQITPSASAATTAPWVYSRSHPTERFRGTSERSSPAPAERSQQAVREARFMISDLSTRVTNDVSPLSSHWLELCLNIFWKKFAPCFPIMHFPTFNVRTTCAPLLLNMIAIGSLCLHSPDDRQKGVALWRLVHKGVAGSWDKLIEIRGPYDDCRGGQLILTSALGQIFAMMSGHPDLEKTAHIFNGNAFAWTKLAGIFDLDLSERPLPLNMSAAETEVAWAKWAAIETQKRAVLAHYIIDGMLTSMGNCGASAKHLQNPFPVAADEQLFAAPSASTWKGLYQSRTNNTTMSDLYRDLIASREHPVNRSPHSPFTTETALEGLHLLITEWEEGQRLSSPPIGGVDMPQIAAALDRFYRFFLDNAPGNTLVETTARWHIVSIKTCRAVHLHMARASHGQPNGHSHVDLFTLPCGRRALLHANAIRQLAGRLPIASADMPHFSLPFSLYDAAKVFLHYLASPAHGSSLCPSTLVRLEEITDWLTLGTTGLSCDLGVEYSPRTATPNNNHASAAAAAAGSSGAAAGGAGGGNEHSSPPRTGTGTATGTVRSANTVGGRGGDRGGGVVAAAGAGAGATHSHGRGSGSGSEHWVGFVKNGGAVNINGMEMGTHELYALTTGLSVFGQVWPRSSMFAGEIQSRVL